MMLSIGSYFDVERLPWKRGIKANASLEHIRFLLESLTGNTAGELARGLGEWHFGRISISSVIILYNYVELGLLSSACLPGHGEADNNWLSRSLGVG